VNSIVPRSHQRLCRVSRDGHSTIPPSDPDFARLYARRIDAESINRNLEDTLFLGRAHSVGHLRQQVDLIGYALLVNGLTVLRQERRGRLPTAA
jgi:hypothetical protein